MELSDHYINVIHKYLNGEAEKGDLVDLLAWLKTNPENVRFFNQICMLWDKSNGSASDKVDTEVALQKLNQKIEEYQDKPTLFIEKQRSIWLWRIAAAFVIMLGAAILIKYINSATKEKITNPDYVIAYAPPSQKSQIILSDGTVVWLNSGTRLKYPTNYGQNTRDVYLEGEAFFKVAKNPKKPFLVHASSVVVKALGTSFNVKCYASDKTIETTLIEGKVQVSQASENTQIKESVLLDPNEKAVYSKENKEIKIALFGGKSRQLEKTEAKKNVEVVYEQKTVQSEISWKEQRLIFENEAFEDLAKRLERWYNVNIRINDHKLLKNRYTGKFVNNEPLEQVLLIIEKTTPITYTIDKDNVIIESKNE